MVHWLRFYTSSAGLILVGELESNMPCGAVKKRRGGHKYEKERGKIFKNYKWCDCLSRKVKRIT